MTAHISDTKPDPKNARKHTSRNLALIESSIQRDGFGRSVLLANDGTVIAGNATIDASASAGLEEMIVVESDGSKIIAVKRTDVAPGSARFRSLALADNRATDLSEFDADVLRELADDGVDLSQFWFDDELDALLADDGFLADALAAGDGASAWPEAEGSDHNRFTIPVTPSERDAIMRAVKRAKAADRSLETTTAALVAICEAF